MHVCPMVTGLVPHVGGPVLPSGCPTVLIGMMPAARVGDMAVCVGPPDVIAKGSATVLIGNMPAARLGDTMAHGGAIVSGCPTVMIGDSGGSGPSGCSGAGNPVQDALLEAKAQRYECRQNLIAQGQDSDDPDVQAAADRFSRENHDIEQAQLSKNVYDPSAGTPPGWTNISNDPAALAKYGLTPDMLQQDGSGFRAQMYEPDPAVFGDDMKPTVAFKGTTASSLEDWQNNAAQSAGLESSYYKNAVQIGNNLSDSGADVDITGHSLGGGMASAASQTSGLDATTFNAAGLNAGTVAKYAGTPMESDINAYHVSGDPLTALQEPSVFRSVIVAGIGEWLGGPLGTIGLSAAVNSVPKAIGTSYELPGSGLNPIDRHSMDQVIAGIEEQKSDDQSTLEEATGTRCP